MWIRLWRVLVVAVLSSAAIVCSAFTKPLMISSDDRARSQRTFAMESFLPTERGMNTADPTARVFNDRLFVYVAWDHSFACGPRNEQPPKKQGSQRFCMVGYRAYSTDDPNLSGRWVTHGAVLREEQVPWLYRGDRGWLGSARMWAPCVMRGDSGKYFLFFPAASAWNHMAIGVAESSNPEGPFIARPRPLNTPFAIDPSVVKLPNGRWAMFTNSRAGVWVHSIDPLFQSPGPRKEVRGLVSGYKEGPFAEVRNGRLMLQYAHFQPGKGYSIMQAVANDPNNPWNGFRSLGVAIGTIDNETNHGSVVSYRSRSWAFYHRHTETPGAPWKLRRSVFRGVTFDSNGRQNPIYPPRT